MKIAILAFALFAVVAADKLTGNEQVPIVRQAADIHPDGSYTWEYETGNGIQAAEQGSQRVLSPEQQATVAQGQFSYTAPDGTPIQVSYVADENGYRPQGDHLPVPPAIPAQIQRALEYLASQPAHA